MVIIVSEGGENAKRIDKIELENEEHLQEYIKKNPDTILAELKNGIKTLAFREFPTIVTGGIDLLTLDRDGEIYVIETKLDRNTTKREVIAQALDYSAALWYHYTEEEFVDTVADLVESEFHMSFKNKIKEFFSLEDEESISAFVEKVKSNLRDGNFKLVLLMDRLDDRLKEMINFMNQKSKFTIYAIEIEQYRVNHFEVVIPKFFGAEVKKEVTVSTKKRVWNEESYFEQARLKISPEQMKTIEKMYEFARSVISDGAGEIRWGTGKNPSFRLFVYNVSESEAIFSIYSDGQLWLSLAAVERERKEEYFNDLSRIKEFAEILKRDQNHYYPKLQEWESAADELIKVVQKLINQAN